MVIKEKTTLLWGILSTFMTISPVSFGGGYALIPLMERVVTEKKRWVNKEEMTDLLVMAQAVPGSVAVNTAIFIGYRLAGIPGAIVGTLGIVAPTFVIIVLLVTLFLNFQHHPIVEAAFMGIRPAVVALIGYAAIKVGKQALINRVTQLICCLSILCFFFLPVHPIVILLAGGISGIWLNMNSNDEQPRYSRGA